MSRVKMYPPAGGDPITVYEHQVARQLEKGWTKHPKKPPSKQKQQKESESTPE